MDEENELELELSVGPGMVGGVKRGRSLALASGIAKARVSGSSMKLRRLMEDFMVAECYGRMVKFVV